MEKVVGFFERERRAKYDPRGMERARRRDEMTANQLRLDITRENLDEALLLLGKRV